MERTTATQHELLDDDKFGELLDRLGDAGWMFGGGGTYQTGEITLGMTVDTDLARAVTEDQLRSGLPVFDDEGVLLDCFELGTDENGIPYVGYDGLVDDRFEQFVDAAVTLLQ